MSIFARAVLTSLSKNCLRSASGSPTGSGALQSKLVQREAHVRMTRGGPVSVKPYKYAAWTKPAKTDFATRRSYKFTAYHGTNAPIDKFDPSRGLPSPHLPPGPNFASSKSEALGYAAGRVAEHGGSPHLIKTTIRIKKPFDDSMAAVPHADGRMKYNSVPESLYKKLVGFPPQRKGLTGYDLMKDLYMQEAVRAVTKASAKTKVPVGYVDGVYEKATAAQAWPRVLDRLKKHGYDGFVQFGRRTDYAEQRTFARIIPMTPGSVRESKTGKIMFGVGVGSMGLAADNYRRRDVNSM